MRFSSRTLRTYSALLFAMMLGLMLCADVTLAATPLSSSTADVRKNAAQQLDQAQKTVEEIQKNLQSHPEKLDDAGLIKMRDGLQQAKNAAVDIATQLEPELTGVQARLTELGTADPAIPEPAEIAGQRAQLTQNQGLLDSQIKLAKLLGVEATQGLDKIAEYRRDRFRAELGRRSQFVLSPAYWRGLQRDLPLDFARANQVLRELGTNVQLSPLKVRIIALSLAALLLVAGEALRRGLAAFAVSHTKPSRLRRSLYATLSILLYTLVPGLLAMILVPLLRWDGVSSTEIEHFLHQFTAAAFLAGFVTGVGSVLLASRRPTWRLPALPNELATRLAWLPGALGLSISAAWVSQQFLDLINATLTATLMVNSVATIVLNILIGITAWSLRGAFYTEVPDADGLPDSNSVVLSWFRTMQTILILVIGVSLAALLLGYVALSTLIVQEIVWLGLVGCTTYVLLALVADIFQSLITRVKEAHARNAFSDSQWRARSQLLVLLSGAAQLALIVVAFTLVLMPFGEAPTDWLNRRLGFLVEGFSIGEVVLKPVSVLLAIGVLVLGVLAVRALRSWIKNQFLPATRLDASMRVSASNLFSYVAYFVVVLMAISSLGFGLERMAWIVSALSVGIGFGLQAIVQNFVSGLILVMERPIRVGDWVSLNGVEGNVRRINARATEIEMFDRSTMIVPNSEFITKAVRNVTMGNPMGVATVKINMPVSADVELVRQMMMQSMQDHPGVLDDPAPSVLLGGFDANGLAFSASCFVSSPRNAARTRSEMLFDMLARFHNAGIPLHHVQSMVVASTVGEAAGDAAAPFETRAPAQGRISEDGRSDQAHNKYQPNEQPVRRPPGIGEP
ncbi:mechanosensitive ion channel family protein [Allopusillimonas ginsengisoli]|nr:mechanosensitive ion channel family protein [Allopusillimonas ginsengisoli]